MTIAVTRDALERLREEAGAAAPDECCGLLLGGAGRIDAILPAANVADTPRTRFEIDPRVLIDAHRKARERQSAAVLGYYHSHPHGEAMPSPCDRTEAAHDGKVWAIVGQAGDVRFWRDGAQGFIALTCTVVGG